LALGFVASSPCSHTYLSHAHTHKRTHTRTHTTGAAGAGEAGAVAAAAAAAGGFRAATDPLQAAADDACAAAVLTFTQAAAGMCVCDAMLVVLSCQPCDVLALSP